MTDINKTIKSLEIQIKSIEEEVCFKLGKVHELRNKLNKLKYIRDTNKEEK